MMLRCYTVFDRKSLVYAPPFFSPTDGSAARALQDAVADTNTPIGSHPNDYVLYYIGTYDDQKGRLEPVDPLVHVIDAIALVKLQPTALPFPGPFSEARPAVQPNGSDNHLIKEA
jgi:hypothetical protein